MRLPESNRNMSENIIAGRYRVLKNKGDNGLCTTHFVEDSLSGKRLVVKVLADTDPVALEYIKKANLLRDSDPKGIILALDGGFIEEPEGFYLAYPLLDGHSLDDYLRVVGSLSASELKRIITSLTKAVGELHERGFLHLFLNPHNILYAPGADVQIKDAALSAELFTPLLERLTSYDYSFFSPELMDSTEGAGQSADIFALGRVMETALDRLERDPLDSESQTKYDRFRDIASQCMELDLQTRYSDAQTVLEAMSKEADLVGTSPTQPLRGPQKLPESNPLLEPPLESSFFDRDAEVEMGPEDRFKVPEPVLSRPARGKAGKFPARGRGFPWLKLVFLGASLVGAICILVMGHDLPGKSARTSENLNSYAGETGEWVPPEETQLSSPGATAEEQGNPAQSESVLFSGSDLNPANPSGAQPGAGGTGAEAGNQQQPDLSAGEPVVSTAQAPVARFVLSPDSGDSPLQVYLDASDSYDPDGTITSFAWSFGGSGAALYHVFESNIVPCSIPITLTVTDERGLSASVTHYVTIY